MPLTTGERVKICQQYQDVVFGQGAQTRTRPAMEAVAAEVGRRWSSVQRVLVEEGFIRPPRPRLSDGVMKAVAEAYRIKRWSLRECASSFGLSYGRVRAVLLYEGVRLRSPGSAGRAMP